MNVTIGELLVLIENRLAQEQTNLLGQSRLKRLRRFRGELGEALGLQVYIPEPPKKQSTKKEKKELVEPSKGFWENLDEKSADADVGADASTTEVEVKST